MEIKINYGLSNLCAAIVLQAAEDLRDAKRDLPEAILNKQNHRAGFLRKRIKECRSFFKSPWCSTLLGERISGMDVMNRVENNAEIADSWGWEDGSTV